MCRVMNEAPTLTLGTGKGAPNMMTTDLGVAKSLYQVFEGVDKIQDAFE